MGTRSTQVRMAEKRTPQWTYGAVGFLLVVSLTIIAYFAAPELIAWLRINARGFSTAGFPDSQVRLMFTGIVFLVLLALVGAVVFAAAPKKKDTSSMEQLVKERELMIREKRAMKRRQRRINRQQREVTRGEKEY